MNLFVLLFILFVIIVILGNLFDKKKESNTKIDKNLKRKIISDLLEHKVPDMKK